MRLALAILVGVLAAGSAHAAGTKTIKDWTGVCDNIGDCAAFGFSPGGQDIDSYVKLQRAAGPAATPTVEIIYDAPDTQPAQTWTIELDNHPVAGLRALRAVGGEGGARAKLSGAAAAGLIAAMKNAHELELVAGGKELVGVSLDGAAGMLLWLDDQQGRVGTVTALGKRGAKPASSVPPPAPMPMVATAGPVSQSGLPDHAPKSLIKDVADCDLDPSVKPDDTVARLAPGVVLWGPQCEMAAYNETSIFFIGDEHARNLKRVRFPSPPGSGRQADDLLFNAGFDPKTQTLSQFSKARGIGDCGQADEWVWTGKAFELLSETVMPECHGALEADWPPLYVARRR
jgi:hypothetical protein